MKLTGFLALLFVLLPLDALAKCRFVPPRISEISVEACGPVQGEPNLLVSGREVAFVELNPTSTLPASIIRIRGWESEPAERFVWTQSDRGTRDCQSITSQEVFLAKLTQPCCDVQMLEQQSDGTLVEVGKMSCIQGLREISDPELEALFPD